MQLQDAEAAERAPPETLRISVGNGPFVSCTLDPDEAETDETRAAGLRNMIAMAQLGLDDLNNRKLKLVLLHAEAELQIQQQLASINEACERAGKMVALLTRTLQDQQKTLAERRARVKLEHLPHSPAHDGGDYTHILNVLPQENIPKHVSLARVFNCERIPVTDLDSMDINYDRVQLKGCVSAPVFTLDLRSVDRKDMALKVATSLVDFFSEFHSFYMAELTRDLFDDLAWRYMSRALEPSNLNTRYDKAILKPQYGNRNWEKVKECLSEIFNFRLIAAEILEQLFTIAPAPAEDVNTYVDRIEVLINATQLGGMDKPLIAKITASLPDVGQEKVMEKFGRLEDIVCVDDLLEFMRKTPSVLSGTRTDRYSWLVNKFTKGKGITVKNDTVTTTPQHHSKEKASRPVYGIGNNKGYHPYSKPGTKGQHRGNPQGETD